MILEIPKEMRRVPKHMFDWFVKALANPKQVQFSNGEGIYDDNTLVAAKTANDQYFIRVRKSGK